MIFIASLVMTLWFLALVLEVTFGGLIHFLCIAALVLATKAVLDANTNSPQVV